MKNDPQIVSIIPARGGSVRIPHKNITLLNGKPLIAYSIESSLRSKRIHRTIVSTDSDEIARISESLGAEVFHRDSSLSDGNSSTELVMIDVLNKLHATGNYPEYLVLLQPTSPLRSNALVDKGIEIVLKTNADTLLSICEIPHYYLSGHFDNGQYLLDYKTRPFSHNMQKKYRENGALYITRSDYLIKHKNRIGGKIETIIMNEVDSIDIDEMKDLVLVEKLLKLDYAGVDPTTNNVDHT